MLQRFKTLVVLFISTISLVLAQEKGKIAGKVEDAGTSEELIGVAIGIEGTSQGAISDLDGNYFLSISPGNYTLVFSYTGYVTKKLPNVEVKAGEVVTLDVSLAESVTETEEVVVVGEMNKETSNTLLLEQKNAISVSSGVSSELIKKTPDRSTADVVKRISGASLVDDKYAIIRGLPDRYNLAFINGAPLPSSESDRKAFSLDFIPANMLDNMKIVKSATPDLPGDFAGGFVQINTKDIPTENQVYATATLGYHSLTSNQAFVKTPVRSKTDWLGYDDGTRALPQVTDKELLETKAYELNQTKIFANETQNFQNNYTPTNVNAANYNLSAQAGISRRINIAGNPLGILLAGTYSNQLRTTPLTQNRALLNPDNPNAPFTDYQNFSGTNYKQSVLAGTMFNLSYKIGLHTKLSLKQLLTLNSEDQSILRTGKDVKDDGTSIIQSIDNTYWYQSSKMYSTQLNNEHLIGKKGIKLKYNLGYTDISRSVPNLSRIQYNRSINYTPEGKQIVLDPITGEETEVVLPARWDTAQYGVSIGPKSLTYDPNQTSKFFSKLREKNYSVSYDLAVPFHFLHKSEVKIGALHQWRDRTFNAKTFLYSYDENNSFAGINNGSIFKMAPSKIFVNDNFRADGLFLHETTLPRDNYQANAVLFAPFFMLENSVLSNLRLIWGARMEKYSQRIKSATDRGPIDTVTTVTDYLPSANIIYSISEKTNLRFGYSQTVSRPEFREFMPFVFYDANLNAEIVGKEGLQRAKINNLDLKYEIYPSPGQFISINPFYKKFDNPIENTVVGGTGIRRFSYQNAKAAVIYGVELEARSSLQYLDSLFSTKYLSNFTIFTNYTLIRSKVDLSKNDDNSTVKERPLQGQSPYVFNAGLTYSVSKSKLDMTVAVNRIGRRIAFVDVYKHYMIWENPRTVIDFSVSKGIGKYLQAKVTIGDLLAQRQVFYQDRNDNGKYDKDDIVPFGYTRGYSVNFGLTFTY